MFPYHISLQVYEENNAQINNVQNAKQNLQVHE